MSILKDSATRIKTALVLFLIFSVVVYIDSFFLFWVLFGGLVVISISEAMNLFQTKSSQIYYYIGAVWFFAYFYPNPEDLIFVVAIIFASILAYTKEFNTKLILVLFYPVVSFLFLLALYAEYGVWSLFWLLAVVAGADIGAYFTGKSIGKTKFCETSPNKTLEGVAGGVVVATILGTIFAIDGVSLLGAIVISFVVAVASVFGDLFESFLKREAGVKDSGNLLPGHGGILDRTDGYLFGGVIMLIVLRAIL